MTREFDSLDKHARPIMGLLVTAVDSKKYGSPPVEIFQDPLQWRIADFSDMRWNVMAFRLCVLIQSFGGDFEKAHKTYIENLERLIKNDKKEIENGSRDEYYHRIRMALRREIYEDFLDDPKAEAFKCWLNANLGNPYAKGNTKLTDIKLPPLCFN